MAILSARLTTQVNRRSNGRPDGRLLLVELSRHICADLSGVPDKLCLQINAALVCKNNDGPQAI
jgi:hypothetical protein